MKVGWRILSSLPAAALTGGLWFFGCIALVFASLHAALYISLLTALAIAIVALLIVWCAGGGRRWLKYPLGLIAVLLLTIGGFAAWHGYLSSIPELGDRGVDLRKYQPFKPESKLARLSEPASWKFRAGDPLPRIDGATALYPVYAAFTEAVYPEGEYPYHQGSVRCGSTAEAYQRLIEGEADLIFCLQPSKEQREAAAAAGLALELTPIGLEAFVFFVNAGNPLENLTLDQVRGIYSGKITRFSEVGGPDELIRPYQRRIGSGSQTLLLEVMGDTPLMAPARTDRLSGMGGIIRVVADYKNFRNALGFSFRYFTREMVGDRKIKLLSLHGVPPTPETIRDGSYPWVTPFFAITARPRDAAVQGFINWILSPQGQALIKATGYTPIKP